MILAILKAINHRTFKFADLAEIDKYITNPAKADFFSVGGYGCPPEAWVACNTALKCQHHAKNKKQFRHFVLGFDDHDRATVHTAMRVGTDVCKYFEGYYAKFAVHTNTPHIHLHIIVGNTSYESGKQLDMPNSALADLKSYCSDILIRNGCGGVRTLKWTVYDKNTLKDAEDLLEISDSLYCIPMQYKLSYDVRQPEYSYEMPCTTVTWEGHTVGATCCNTAVELHSDSSDGVFQYAQQYPSETSPVGYYVVELKPPVGMTQAFHHKFDTLEQAVAFCGEQVGREGIIRWVSNPFIKT